MAGTFNPSDTHADITLSNGNLTATKDGTATYKGTRATIPAKSGDKVYFEHVISTEHGSGIGVANSSESLSNWVGQTTNSIGWYADGSVWRNGSSIATVAAWVANNRLCIAVDRVNGNIWFRVGSGNWNNSGSANPATNTGGISISVTGDLYPYFTPYGAFLSGDVGTITLSPAFVQAVPTGFTAVGAHVLTADKGTYTLTGQAAATRVARKLVANQGTYSLSGQAATLRAAKRLAADQGSYTLTGQAAEFILVSRILTADAGSYTLSGQAAVLSAARKLIANQGSYSLTGQAAVLARSHVMPADFGSYSLSGQAAQFVFARKVTVEQGSYALTGIAANFQLTRVLMAAAGTYNYEGQVAEFYPLAYERPNADVSIGGWKTYLDGTTDLWDMIDEPNAPDDGDYIKSSALESGDPNDVAEFALSDQPDPNLSVRHRVRYRYRKQTVGGSGVSMNLQVRLLQGATEIAAWNHSDIGTSFITAEQTLSSGQADAITDYSDLRLEFTAEAP